MTLAGHTEDEISSVAVVPDGRVITGAYDSKIRVWRDGACERTINAHTDQTVWAMAVLPGGARIVTCSPDRTAKLWTLDGALERTFEVGAFVYAVAPLPDGMHFVVGTGWYSLSALCEIRLYNVDGTLVHTFKETHKYTEVLALAVTPDGQHIISGKSDRVVKVWSVATKSLVSTCEGHISDVSAVAAMPDGKRFLSGADTTIRVWLVDGTHENTFDLHTNMVYEVVALPDNQHALSGSLRHDRQALRRQRRRRPAHLQAPRETGALPGAAARRPPLRQRLERQHRPHRRARPRAAVKIARRSHLALHSSVSGASLGSAATLLHLCSCLARHRCRKAAEPGSQPPARAATPARHAS